MSWKKWCRLCGNIKEKVIEIFIKNENLCTTSLSETIQRVCAITISDYDEAPKIICTSCQEFINKITDFSLKATKIQEMYSELEFNDKFEMLTNFEQIREKYGFNDENKYEIFKEIQHEKILSDNDASDDDNIPLAQCTKKLHRRFQEVNCIKEERTDEEITEKEDSQINYDIIGQNDIGCNSAKDKDLIIKEKFNGNKIKKYRKNKIEITNIIKEPTIFCEICNKGLINQVGYKAHLKIAHKIIKKLECKICGKSFRRPGHLKSHENTHLPPDQRKLYPCPHCDRKFTHKTNIAAHIRAVHIKEKRFVCEECGRAFSTNARLASHKFVHTDERTFQCSKCSKSFKCSKALKHHIDSHDDTKYICPICGTQLNTKRILRGHMIIHSDEKKYKCNFCDKDFKRPKTLKNHLILHTGLKPYQCPFCDQTFATGSNCRQHKKTTHPKELAEAEEAGTIYITKNIPSMQLLKAVNEEAMLNNKNSEMKIQ